MVQSQSAPSTPLNYSTCIVHNSISIAMKASKTIVSSKLVLVLWAAHRKPYPQGYFHVRLCNCTIVTSLAVSSMNSSTLTLCNRVIFFRPWATKHCSTHVVGEGSKIPIEHVTKCRTLTSYSSQSPTNRPPIAYQNARVLHTRPALDPTSLHRLLEARQRSTIVGSTSFLAATKPVQIVS